MAITGISSYDGKQIIAAGAQSAISAGIASNINYADGHGTEVFIVGYSGPQFHGGLIVGDSATDNGVKIYPSGIEFLPWEGTALQITSGKVAKWDSLSADKQDKLTFGYTDNQISQINGSAIYSQGGGGGGYTGNVQQALDEVYGSSATWNTVTDKLDAASQVVTATGGTTTYVQTINGKNISATNAGSALSATNAYNLTNTAIKVASATSATNANTATYASNGVSLTNIYNSARSGYAASAYLVNNVTGKVSNWNNCYSSYTSHSGNWADITAVNAVKPTFSRVSNYGTTNLGQLTATGVGAGKLVIDLGSIFNSGYNMIEWSYCDMNGFWGDDKAIYWFTFGARLNNILATQWTEVSNPIKLKKANAVFLHEFAFMNGDRWSPTHLSIVCDGAWATAAQVIRRDIRNNSTADNNDFYLSFNGFIYAP